MYCIYACIIVYARTLSVSLGGVCAANTAGDDKDEERDGEAGDGHQEVHRRRPLLPHPRRRQRPRAATRVLRLQSPCKEGTLLAIYIVLVQILQLPVLCCIIRS
jgi:hypothetical protein